MTVLKFFKVTHAAWLILFPLHLYSLSTDSFFQGDTIVLPKVREDRIIQLQHEWATQFDDAEMHRLHVYGGVTLGALTCAGCLWYLFSHSPQSNTSMNDAQVNAAYTQLRFEELSHRFSWRNSWQGKLAWMRDNIFETVVTTIILALSARLATSSWSTFQQKIYDFLGPDGQDIASKALVTYFEAVYRLIKSLQSVATTVQGLHNNDALHTQLRLHMVRGIMIDHYAFVDASEHVLALGKYLTQTYDALTDEQRQWFNTSITQVFELTNGMIEREEKALHDIYCNNDSKQMLSLQNVLDGICHECVRLLGDIGVLVYGKDFERVCMPAA